MGITEETEAESRGHRQQEHLQRATSVARHVILSINKLQETQQKGKDKHQPQMQHAEHVKFSVNDMLSKVHPSYSPPCIYRVPDSVRGVNPQCYTPRLVSIGPFHRDKPQLNQSEGLKIRLFKNFLNREPTDERKLLKMGLLVAENESEIRKYYPPDEIKLNSEDFCLMILVDATFIVELLVMKGEGDPMTANRWLFGDLLNDILLIENQIPLFIIYEIYIKFYEEDNLLRERYGKKDFFLNRIHKFIQNVKNEISTDDKPFPTPIVTLSSQPEGYPVHFVDYLRLAYVFGVSNSEDTTFPVKRKEAKGKRQVLEEGQSSGHNQRQGQILLPPKKKKWKYEVVTASRLVQYGVQFKEGTTTSLKGIKFKSREGILEINKVIVNESTENIFRNIVAYEQCDLISQTYVSDYLIFMDSLIDTPEDVNILTDAGIIQNDLQDPEKISQMFNTLHKEVITEGKDYLFAAQSHELNDYRRNMWHRWKATWYNWNSILKRDYFNSPWSTIAFITAAMLVGLTIIQTICSVYQAKGIKL